MIESGSMIGAANASAWRVKLALTLLDETERNLDVSGAPAAPRPPVSPAVLPLVPGLDFPSLIAARLVLVARSKPASPRNPARRFNKKG
jgi:hypothetical protein